MSRQVEEQLDCLHINIGALIIRIGFWGGADMSLIRRKLQMSCASLECSAIFERTDQLSMEITPSMVRII